MTRARPEIPVPPALIDEILAVAESPREVRDMLDRLEERLEGVADWQPFRRHGVGPAEEDDGRC